jgi:hypothetical protein
MLNYQPIEGGLPNGIALVERVIKIQGMILRARNKRIFVWEPAEIASLGHAPWHRMQLTKLSINIRVSESREGCMMPGGWVLKRKSLAWA